MSKNDIYTYDYFQPDGYRFSLDSVFLAQKVSKIIAESPDLPNWKVLDLCAGCGIIGLELSLHQTKLLHIDFLEVQEIYQSYFQKNIDLIWPHPRNQKLSFLPMNYQQLLCPKYENSYDLIVSNPPYFIKGEGLLSPNEFKNRCRFFLDSDFQTLIHAIVHVLNPGAVAFLLVRKGDHHGRVPLEEIKSILKEKALTKIIDNVRGTDIIQIQKSF